MIELVCAAVIPVLAIIVFEETTIGYVLPAESLIASPLHPVILLPVIDIPDGAPAP